VQIGKHSSLEVCNQLAHESRFCLGTSVTGKVLSVLGVLVVNLIFFFLHSLVNAESLFADSLNFT